MIGDEDWTHAIERVLLAETADLRELAQIGGVDPRTAYIGTRLDGADLRGQDLRGMLFTELDLTKVKHDAGTQIDPDQLLQPPDKTPVILLAARRWSPSAVHQQLRFAHVRILEPRQWEEYRLAISGGAVGLILGHSREPDEIAEVLARLATDGTRHTLIVQGRIAKASHRPWEAWSTQLNVVFCNDLAMSRLHHAQGLETETPHLIRFLLENSERLNNTLSYSSLYIRTSGRGPQPIIDAGAQLIDRIWRSDLQNYRLGIFAFFDHPRRDLIALEDLLSPQSMQHVSAAPGVLHALVSLTDGSEKWPTYTYREAIMRTRERLASSGERHQRQSRRYGGKELTIQESLTPSTIRLNSRPPLDHLRFSDIGRVTLSPYADLVTVVSNLLIYRELWVNARDVVSTGEDDEITVWNLIAGQMRRFALSQSGAYRQTYLELILLAGARLGGMHDLIGLLSTEVSIRLEGLETKSGTSRFRTTVIPEGVNAKTESSVSLGVSIDKFGPQLTRL